MTFIETSRWGSIDKIKFLCVSDLVLGSMLYLQLIFLSGSWYFIFYLRPTWVHWCFMFNFLLENVKDFRFLYLKSNQQEIVRSKNIKHKKGMILSQYILFCSPSDFHFTNEQHPGSKSSSWLNHWRFEWLTETLGSFS